MKLLRVGLTGKEKPAALDKNAKIRDLSSHIADFNPENLNFESINKLSKLFPPSVDFMNTVLLLELFTV